MNNNVNVSIIMPVYNVENYIEDSINSVLRQTYKDIELIIVDDGSSDNSINIAKQILCSSKINYKIIHQDNAGSGMARNAGMDCASGNWIFFLDSDDLISDNAIEHLVSVGQSQNVELVLTDYNEIHHLEDAIQECKKDKVIYFSSDDLQLEFLKRSIVVLAPGTLYKKQFLDEYGLRYEMIPWSEDQHFVWRVLYQINKAGYIKEPLYQYLRHSGSIMSATRIEAMVESYPSICSLKTYYGANKIGEFIVSRWVMGTLNSATVMTGYRQWSQLATQINMKGNFYRLLKFPSLKVRISAFLGLCTPKLYYEFNKKRKR